MLIIKAFIAIGLLCLLAKFAQWHEENHVL